MPASRPTPPAPRPRDPRAGFALLLTITLLAFVVVLLIGLATYTRVETAIAGNTQRQAQARQNALLGLDVALGQLQKYAGPDQRVTATAEAFPNGAGASRYTGVWSSEPAATADATPLTWLASGNELAAADGTPAPLAITPASALNTINGIALVSSNTSRTANDILARLMPVTAIGVPGVSPAATATIGRYAWWVGDQGVKAPVAIADASSTVTYAPYDSAELRARLRQQISLGAGALNLALTTPQVEPRDGNNATLVANGKVLAASQLAFLKTASSTGAAAPTTAATIGLVAVQQNFHAWSPNNFNVLANTKTGGLRQDLSLAPALLGDAFTAWANYPAYMEPPTPNGTVTAPEGGTPGETPATSGTVAIQPAYGTDPLRRRYNMQLGLVDQGLQHSVAPVLAECGLSFNIRTQGSKDGPLEVRARWYVSLWNPYSSALVPEKNMRLEIEGLPDPVNFTVTVTPTAADQPPVVTTVPVSLEALFQDAAHPGWKFPINLAWDESKVAGQPDMQSWLPGRVYTWISTEHSLTPTPPGGLSGEFYATNFSAVAGQGDTRAVSSSGSFPADDDAKATVTSFVSFSGPVQLRAKLYRSDADATPLATYNVPDFAGVPTTDATQKPKEKTYQFGFIFRLFESGHVDSGDKGEWLTGAGAVDPRASSVPPTALRVDSVKGNDPAQYRTALDFNDPKFLLDRTQGADPALSYNEDAPLFELPRSPLLSLGLLQHLQVAGHRPFSIGNSWGAEVQVGGVPSAQLFDRFFFSGLAAGVFPAVVNGALLLPNPSLKVLRDSTTHAAVSLAALQAAPDSRSSKFLLSGGAFNLNSVSAAAWAAVLRGVRFPAPQSFAYLDVDATTGTAADASVATVQSGDAQFFRFSQSAQETYKAEAGNSGGAAATELFRKGMITLTTAQVAALAKNIAAAVKAHHAASGPFRTLEEFLGPVDGGASLLEQAIEDAKLNTGTEFSSQFLTQADIMTALAPVLFPRSDTFVIRSYGEAVNPATNATEGRAWCEAIVQRVPEYLDKTEAEEIAPADLTSDLNKNFGRRFKVVSFRWLTRSDI